MVPDKVEAFVVIVMSDVPSKGVPLMLRAVVSFVAVFAEVAEVAKVAVAARVAVAALPEIFPVTFAPETVAILASITAPSMILAVVTEFDAIAGAAAVPVKSPAN